MVSYLVLTAFTGMPPKGYYVRFCNKDRADNRLENLMWAGKPA